LTGVVWEVGACAIVARTSVVDRHRHTKQAMAQRSNVHSFTVFML
jgi:hypothetical protein